MELQRIKLLEDRSRYPRVRVKETDDNSWKERICLYINENNHAVCVNGEDEKSFLQGREFIPICWTLWEETKEPTYRPYENSDNVEHLLGAKIKRKRYENEMHLIPNINKGKATNLVKFNNYWTSSVALFENYLFLDGTPIGVKE